MNTDKRTDEELNRIIAEWCGWKWEPHASGTCLRDPSGSIVNNNYAEDWRIPNYCRDLNAVHEAEKKVLGSSTGWCDFALALMSVLDAADMSELDGMTCILQATARQRAEALVRVIEGSKQ